MTSRVERRNSHVKYNLSASGRFSVHLSHSSTRWLAQMRHYRLIRASSCTLFIFFSSISFPRDTQYQLFAISLWISFRSVNNCDLAVLGDPVNNLM